MCVCVRERERERERVYLLYPLSVGGLAADHISGLAFGGMRPHSPDEHVQDPNVLVIHSAEAR